MNNISANKAISSLFLFLISFTAPFALKAQDVNYTRQSPLYHLLERTELKSGTLNNDLFLDIAPLSRADVADYFNKTDSVTIRYSKADKYWLQYHANDNLPYSNAAWNSSKKPILHNFYEGKANIYQICTKDSNLMLFLNPVLNLSFARARVTGGLAPGSMSLTTNTRGAELRGEIDKKIGFYTMVTDNQVIYPRYVSDYKDATGWYPGLGYAKVYHSTGVDYFNALAYITFSPTKHIRFQFGNDKNFIGSGFRSLLLSDFAKDYLQLKITTKIWRFDYQNIFAVFVDGQQSTIKPYPAKYGSFHYLSYNVAKFFNLGLFEGIMFNDVAHNGRGYDINYLNPVIFYRSVEQNLGSSDNALLGANFNILPVKGVLLYGQVLLDEFRLNEVIKNNRGWWGNKYGFQAGAKWIDAFGLPNVDLQLELNQVRPYTYSEDTSGSNYSHYSQSLAHPLGANLREIIAMLNLNPKGPILISFKYFYIQQGKDYPGGPDMGSNILISYYAHPNEYGNHLLQGVPTTINIMEAVLSYQLKHNLFVDMTLLNRSEKSSLVNSNTFYIGAGMRLNFNYSNNYF